MSKVKINNRKGQTIVTLLEETPTAKGLAIVMHGLSGNKEQPHIATFAESFKEEGYTVLRFDTTNTFGESDGKYEEATVTNYYEDLEDVIGWAKTQPWYHEPFYLAGHSLGGIAVALYAEQHPNEIKGLAPIATVISGKLSVETPKYKAVLEEWEKTGWKIGKHETLGIETRLPWSHMVDRLKYDVLNNADKLTMPVLLIVGDQDDGTPYEHQKLLYDAVLSEKEIHVIKGAPHTLVEPQQLAEVKELFQTWIEKVDTSEITK